MPESLSILVPVYNEERTIVSVMQRLHECWPAAQIVYIDDGSKDNSLSLMKAHARPQDTVLTKPNGGKGSAILLGLKHAKEIWTTIQDADLEYDPNELHTLLAIAEKTPGVVVFGSRFLMSNPNLYKRYLLGNKVMTWCVNILFGSRLTDAYTCYKLFPTKVLQSLPLTARGFDIEAELCGYPLLQKLKIVETAIHYHPRSMEEGKKIRPSDAWKGICVLLRIRFRRPKSDLDTTVVFNFRSYEGRHPFVMETLGNRALKLLDVGNLGDGDSTNLLLKKEIEARGGTYVGLDSNEPLTKKMNLPNQIVGDLHHAPFGDNEFDAIYAGEIIEHTWTPSLMISECYRILKPGGELILDTPNPFAVTRLALWLLRKQDGMRDVRSLTYHEAKDRFGELKNDGDILLQPQHKIFFTPAMMKQLLETHGFQMVSIGCTRKMRSWAERILLTLFPHGGQHLCIVAVKSTLDEVYADISTKA